MDIQLIAMIVVFVVASCIYFYLHRWIKYDPSWLLELALEQYPDDKSLHAAISKCNKIRGADFVDSRNPNKPGSEWQFERSITLIHPEMNEIVLDILKDGRIGSIEYLGLMLKKNKKPSNES